MPRCVGAVACDEANVPVADLAVESLHIIKVLRHAECLDDLNARQFWPRIQIQIAQQGALIARVEIAGIARGARGQVAFEGNPTTAEVAHDRAGRNPTPGGLGSAIPQRAESGKIAPTR